MLMALILKSKEERHACENMEHGNRSFSNSTLVVAKLSLLPQWEEELKSKSNLSYFVYYGNQRPPSVDELRSVDVVITTYGTIQGELRRKNPVLLETHWLRVILDEAHCIRNQRTLASKVCCQLTAKHRWAVSGTIIQNSLDDVLGIMKFLKHEPWCFDAFWRTAISVPANYKVEEDNEPGSEVREQSLKTALDRVRRLLVPIMLRRTKNSLTKEGKPILSLPPVETKIVEVGLTESEREFYNAVLARSLEVFDGFVEAGVASKSYFQILCLLQRLRQVCDHISLTVKSKIGDDEWNASIVQDPDTSDCSAVVRGHENPQDLLGRRFFEELLEKFCKNHDSPCRNKKRVVDVERSDSGKRVKKDAYASTVAETLSKLIKANSTHIDEECAICLDNPKIDEVVLTPCAHIFCRSCLIDTLRNAALKEPKSSSSNALSTFHCPDGLCPTCQEKIVAKRIIVLTKSEDDGHAMTTRFLTDMKSSNYQTTMNEIKDATTTRESNPHASARQILEDAVSGSESSKLNAVMNELDAVWTLDPNSKILVFSHYLGFLDIMETQLRLRGISFFRLDGKLSLKERMRVLDAFRSCNIESAAFPSDSVDVVASGGKSVVKRGLVLLMSMNAGGEGLNLVAASSAFVVEPWWNSAREDVRRRKIGLFCLSKQIIVYVSACFSFFM